MSAGTVTITRSYRSCDVLKPGTYASTYPLPLCTLPAGHEGNHEAHRREPRLGLVRVMEWSR